MATESSNPHPQVTQSSSPPPYPPGTSSEQIRRDIDRTRADLDETVDTLEQRLHPRHLLDDVLDIFRGSSAGGSAGEQVRRTGSKVLEKLKEHPMPAALIGAGIAWLMFEDEGGGASRSQYQSRKWDVPPYSGSYVDARTGQPYDVSSYGPSGTSGMAPPRAGAQGGGGSGGGGATGGGEPGMMDKAKEMASSAGERMSDWAGSARDMASGAGQSMREYSTSASDQMRRGYESGRHYVERGIEEYPLAMGAAAMAVGVLAGLCMPRTRTEDRLMGEQADMVKERAKEAGEQAVESGKRIAQAGAQAAASEAAPDNLADRAKHVVQDVTQAAKESAQREGLDPDSLKQKARDAADRASQAARDEADRQRREFQA